MSLKEKLFLSYQGTKAMSKFLQTIKSTAEQLALISALCEENDIVLHYLNALSIDFKEISSSICVWGQPISFKVSVINLWSLRTIWNKSLLLPYDGQLEP